MLVRLGQTLMLLASARGAAGRHRSRQHFRRKLPPDVIADVNTMFSEMTAYHPQCPHWYLPTIGGANPTSTAAVRIAATNRNTQTMRPGAHARVSGAQQPQLYISGSALNDRGSYGSSRCYVAHDDRCQGIGSTQDVASDTISRVGPYIAPCSADAQPGIHSYSRRPRSGLMYPR